MQLLEFEKPVAELEREIETAKTSLTLKSDFNLQDAFRIFDVNYRGTIGSCELRDGLLAIGVYPTNDELELFMSRYDKSGMRRLTAVDFSEAFLTHDAYYAGML